MTGLRCSAGSIASIFSIFLLLGCAGVVSAPQSNQGKSTADPRPVHDHETNEALAILWEMAEFLVRQPRMSLSADVSYDVVQSSGQKLEFGSTRRIAMRRPDRFRLLGQPRDGAALIVYFDGRRISTAIPEERIYASIEVPGTLAQATDYLVDEVGVPAPLADLLHPSFYADVSAGIESGILIGEEWVGDVRCEHLAFRGAEVDFQVWIQMEKARLPKRIVIGYRKQEGAPQFSANLTHWDLSPDLPDELFIFTPPPGAIEVTLGEMAERMDATQGGRQ